MRLVQLFQLKYDKLLSSLALKFNFCHCNKDEEIRKLWLQLHDAQTMRGRSPPTPGAEVVTSEDTGRDQADGPAGAGAAAGAAAETAGAAGGGRAGAVAAAAGAAAEAGAGAAAVGAAAAAAAHPASAWLKAMRANPHLGLT